ncbi:biotin transporter BioY [Arenibaculum pallidiluteum]|uniref:biotin transporter BioY n=1 Tax=Arenibaculum pallidiluteum TaxID=2812559 RepID=UPI001A97252A|nr:biotin transporter BioY [Arenibaculum pallidiluteum]
MSAQSLTARPATLLDAVMPERGLARAALLAVFGSVLLAVSAKVQVPFQPVPMTMQTLVVLALGMAYGSRLGAATVALYLAQGLAGLPVFAGPLAGPAYFAGPTAGFLLGFVMAAALVGLLAERGWDRHWASALAAMAIGHVVLFVPGVAWLSLATGLEKAIALGVTPFVAATLLKTALGCALMQAAWHVVARRSA